MKTEYTREELRAIVISVCLAWKGNPYTQAMDIKNINKILDSFFKEQDRPISDVERELLNGFIRNGLDPEKLSPFELVVMTDLMDIARSMGEQIEENFNEE